MAPESVRGLACGALLALVGCDEGELPAPPPGVDVTAYVADLALDPATLRLDGSARLLVEHPGALRVLDLRLAGPQVEAVEVNGRPVPFEQEGDVLRVPLAAGTRSTVQVEYAGVPAEGVYAGEAGGQRVVFTDGWPARVAGWLPVVAHPSDPAALRLSLHVPDAYEVVASGQPEGVDEGRNGRRFTYRLDADAPVYTFAFAAADTFTVVRDTTAAGLPIRHVLLEPEKAALLGRTPAVLDTLAALLGPYPYASYTTVQVPLAFAGMENAAAPFLRADLYQRRDGRNEVEEVNVHEAVHQWFGNDVVPSDWRELWLAEGFATYLTTVVYERLDGPEAARRQRVRMARLDPRDARRALVPEDYDEPEELLSATVYQKGAAVLHLFRVTLGDAVFFGALRRLADDYADRPLSTAALQTVLEQESGRDLDGWFDYWVYGERIPTLRTRWDAAARRLTWQIGGDEETLSGVPFELLIRQGARDVYARADAGTVVLSGSEPPAVYPVGVLLRVES